MTKDRYDTVEEVTRKKYDEFVGNKDLSSAFIHGGGEDLLPMLKDVAYGSLEAWDVRCMYTQFLKGQYTVYPAQSLIFNIGFDGTGMHCGRTDKFNVPLSDKVSFSFPNDVVVNREIVDANRKFRALPSYPARVAAKLLSMGKAGLKTFMGHNR